MKKNCDKNNVDRVGVINILRLGRPATLVEAPKQIRREWTGRLARDTIEATEVHRSLQGRTARRSKNRTSTISRARSFGRLDLAALQSGFALRIPRVIGGVTVLAIGRSSYCRRHLEGCCVPNTTRGSLPSGPLFLCLRSLFWSELISLDLEKC